MVCLSANLTNSQCGATQAVSNCLQARVVVQMVALLSGIKRNRNCVLSGNNAHIKKI